MDFRIEWHERLGSTNTFLRDRFDIDPQTPSGLIVAAHDQTDGRGRQDRTWQSAPNTNLCFSLFIETRAPLIRIPSLTMAVALAVSDMLTSRGFRPAPKWPNDVLICEKKICGILSEQLVHGQRHGVIIGVGLNVNMTDEEAAHIDRPATSMLIEKGEAYPLPDVLESLLPHVAFWIERWESGGFPAIREEWTAKAGPIGKPLSIHDGDIRRSGRLAGFGEHGELLLKTENGVETIWSGDVS